PLFRSVAPYLHRPNVAHRENLALVENRVRTSESMISAAADERAADSEAGEVSGRIDVSRKVTAPADHIAADLHRANPGRDGEGSALRAVAADERTADGEPAKFARDVHARVLHVARDLHRADAAHEVPCEIAAARLRGESERARGADAQAHERGCAAGAGFQVAEIAFQCSTAEVHTSGVRSD